MDRIPPPPGRKMNIWKLLPKSLADQVVGMFEFLEGQHRQNAPNIRPNKTELMVTALSLFPNKTSPMFSICNESLRGFFQDLIVFTMVIVNCESFLLVKRGPLFKESVFCNWSKRQQVGFLFAKFISNLLPFFQEIHYLSWWWIFLHASWWIFMLTCSGTCCDVPLCPYVNSIGSFLGAVKFLYFIFYQP